MKPLCACGCGERSVHGHHAIRRQTIKQAKGNPNDRRWIIPLTVACHFNHEHGPRDRKLPLAVLTDDVFAVASETFGPGRAYNELRRAYIGGDRRLDALLGEWEAAA